MFIKVTPVDKENGGAMLLPLDRLAFRTQDGKTYVAVIDGSAEEIEIEDDFEALVTKLSV